MPYTINKYSGVELVVLDDGTIDTTTSLGLVGRNYVGYGETQNENFVFLLENFANDTPPARPLSGQTWFNTDNNLLHAYDGTKWIVVGSAVISETPPDGPPGGAFWFKSPTNSLHVYNGSQWVFIGPENAEGFGETRTRSGTLVDADGNTNPVIFLTVDDTVLGIISNKAFTPAAGNSISGFGSLAIGLTMSTSAGIKSNLTGRADRATRLETTRLINGVGFDGQTDITIKSSTTNYLTKGAYILGDNFDGSAPSTWAVDATPSNVIGKVVARNSEGGFSASTITANLIGNITGNVTAASGTSSFDVITANNFIGATLSGNAFSATQLQTPRTINGVLFNGTENITIASNAQTLTGTYIANTVLTSNLQQVGTLNSLNVADAGITLGVGSSLRILVDSSVPTIRSFTGTLNFDMGDTGPDISFVNSARSLALGGPNAPAIIGDNTTNLGITGYKFNNIYANNFLGNATTATLATTATNIAGGGAGAIPYQTAIGTTALLPVGTTGQILKAGSGNTIQWENQIFSNLTKKTSDSYLVLTTVGGDVSSYNTQIATTISVDATSASTANKVVARDSTGGFSATNITAALIGNSTSATRLQTARTINGIPFDGTGNITISTNYTILSGANYSIAGFTNQVGSFNNGANYFDVFPPSGKSMANIVAFIPSIHVIHFAGGVNGDDSMRCTYSYLGDRIRVYVQNTEQRSTPAANWLAVWS